MKKQNLKIKTIIASIAGAALISLSAFTHDMWNETQGEVKKGDHIKIKMISDHSFPPQHNETVPVDQLSKSYIIAPDGSKSDIASAKGDIFNTKNKCAIEGTYLIVSGKNWMYWTQTTTGWEPGKNKKEVKSPVKGVHSVKFTKSLVTIGKSAGKAFSSVQNQTLEIIPLADPAALSTGDKLPIKILFKNKPAKSEVKATYEGYSTKENEFAISEKIDNNGECKIKLAKNGRWIIRVEVKEDSADKTLSDEEMYVATLTFTVK